MHRIQRPQWGRSAVVGVLALVALTLGRQVGATEPLDDLGVSLRALELLPDKGPAGPSMTGVARIEVFVEAFRETRDVELRILRPDGSAWTVRGRPFAGDRPVWTGPGGEPIEPNTEGATVRARRAIRTTIAVPLQGAAIHEIVVAVTGLVGGDPVSTTGVARVALGVPHNQPVDDGTYANFSVTEAY